MKKGNEWTEFNLTEMTFVHHQVLCYRAITFDLFSMLSFYLSMLHCTATTTIISCLSGNALNKTQVSCARIWLFWRALTYIYFISYSLGIYVGGLCWSYFVTDTRTGVKLCWGHPNPFALSNPARPLVVCPFLCLCLRFQASPPICVLLILLAVARAPVVNKFEWQRWSWW